jgi:hypothetical protein
MRTRGVALLLSGMVLGMLLLWGLMALQPYANAYFGNWCIAPRCRCGGEPVQARIHQGPDAPMDLSGDLVLDVNLDGSFAGDLVTNQGMRVRVTGQGVAHGADIVLDLGDGRRIFTHMALEYDIRQCRGGGRGIMIGPRYGNFGDWGRRIISPT